MYEIARGDTLWAISRRMLGDPYRWPVIYAANRTTMKDPDVILPGQRIVVPEPPAREPR